MEHTVIIEPNEISDELGVVCYGVVCIRPIALNDESIALRLSQDATDPNDEDVYWLVELNISRESYHFITNGKESYWVAPDRSHRASGPAVVINGEPYHINVLTGKHTLPQYAILLGWRAMAVCSNGGRQEKHGKGSKGLPTVAVHPQHHPRNGAEAGGRVTWQVSYGLLGVAGGRGPI